MNKTLEAFARQQLKDTLAKCTEGNRHVFKLMYSRKTDDSAADLDKPIDAVVDAMPIAKLDWAMEQVERTLAKNEIKAPA